MDRLLNYLRGLLNIVAEVERLRLDMQKVQSENRQRDVNEQIMIARIRELTQRLEHSEQLHASEARAIKAEREAELLRFERRLPPA